MAMIDRNSIQRSLYLTGGVLVLTLTGIFNAFQGRAVIQHVLDFDQVVLFLMIGLVSYVVTSSLRERGIQVTVVNGLLSGLIVGVALAGLVILQSNVDMRFVFQNLGQLNAGTLTFEREISLADGQVDGLLLLLGFSALVGGLTGLFVLVPQRLQRVLLISGILTIVLGLVYGQVQRIITLPDALALVVTFGLTYIVAWQMALPLTRQAGAGLALGAAIGVVLAIVANAGGLESGGVLRGVRAMPVLLNMSVSLAVIPFVAILAVVGLTGALAVNASRLIHNGSIYFLVFLLVLGVLNWRGSMDLLAAAMVMVLLTALFYYVPLLGAKSEETFEEIAPRQRRRMQGLFIIVALLVILIAPQFMGLYISNVINLIALYAIMGIGLNVMIGYAGLLDLGYVASFAIGAYTLGILTSPNTLTCGGVHPNDIPFNEIEATCTGTLSFWAALPFCVAFSAITGALLGIPVLRLRGDYLAIVTLGFGEIINRVIMSNTFKPLLGGPQGITPIPMPELNLTAVNENWLIQFNNSTSMYYLFLFGVAFAAFIVYRMANSRTGRAWRAVRADEDVAQAMGINLVRTKLLAFGVSSAFAGLGGAIFGASVQGIFPNSFTLMVSINVLSLIIIGGMGSIPGMIVGAMILVGLPELLRELDAYRLLAFGALLVTVMILKPDGLLPPSPPKLSEKAEEAQAQEASHG